MHRGQSPTLLFLPHPVYKTTLFILECSHATLYSIKRSFDDFVSFQKRKTKEQCSYKKGQDRTTSNFCSISACYASQMDGAKIQSIHSSIFIHHPLYFNPTLIINTTTPFYINNVLTPTLFMIFGLLEVHSSNACRAYSVHLDYTKLPK